MDPSAHIQSPQEPNIRLFRHRKRQRWGVAALVWERDGKRGYQFADGQLRVFKEGFYHFLESAPAPGDGSVKAVRRLARLARSEGVRETTRLPTLRDQIRAFTREYPEGFTGAAWMSQRRGAGARRRIKRHRDPAIDEARRLGAEELAPLIERGDWHEVRARLLAVVRSTTMVQSAQLKKLEAIAPSRDLSLALFEWIRASEHERERGFNRFVRALGEAATWSVVTVVGALVDPARHVCVRPSVFDVQGKMLLAKFALSSRPSHADYARCVDVANTVFDELTQAGLGPRDLVDVHDFVWETLRPAAREALTRELPLAGPSEAVVAPAPEVSANEAASDLYH